MERDFAGYGNHFPKVIWPHHAQIAINFVLNYEEGAERNILDGDDQSENYLADWPGLCPLKHGRHLSSESLFEYGSRAGVWRLLALFESYGIPLTIFAAGLALERNLALANKLKNSPHEIAGHGYRWIDYAQVDEKTEREHIKKTIEIIHSLTKKSVAGWYTGRRSMQTRKLIVEAGLRYDSDSYADDLPYWLPVSGHNHLIIPYSLDTNDARYVTSPGWNTGKDFFRYLKDTFDYLYREGLECPKMMTIGMHARLSGRPGRCGALSRFIDYLSHFDKVWICRREEVASYWYQHHSIDV